MSYPSPLARVPPGSGAVVTRMRAFPRCMSHRGRSIFPEYQRHYPEQTLYLLNTTASKISRDQRDRRQRTPVA